MLINFRGNLETLLKRFAIIFVQAFFLFHYIYNLFFSRNNPEKLFLLKMTYTYIILGTNRNQCRMHNKALIINILHYKANKITQEYKGLVTLNNMLYNIYAFLSRNNLRVTKKDFAVNFHRVTHPK